MVDFTFTEPIFSVKKVKVKKTLNDLIFTKEIITGKEVIHNLKELEDDDC